MNRLILATLLLTFSLSQLTYGQFTGMRPRIPKDANTLILFNTDKMFGSKVADRENWKARRDAAYQAGLLALPPDATEVALAGRMDIEYGDTVWELALVKLLNDRNVSTVAARFGGTMDTIVGRSAARLPNDQFVVQISSKLMGAYTPANRQDVSRWLRSTDVTTPQKLSPYLERAFDYATKVGTPIVMAIDLEGHISPDLIKDRLGRMAAMEGIDAPIDQIAKVIEGVRGATLGVTLQDKTVAAIRVDFDSSPEVLAEVGKPIFIEVLERSGAMIEDIRDWEPSVSGNTFLLRGTLTDNGARRVLSVLELPRSLSDALHDAQSAGSDPEGTAKMLATKQYYNSVTTLIEDLRGKPKRDRVKTFGQAAIWYDKYARKIDHLPILGVDPDLLQYGTRIASMFREAEGVMKGVGMRTSMRTASNNPSSGGFSYSVDGYRANSGYWGVNFGPSSSQISLGPGRASLQEKGRTDAIIPRTGTHQGCGKCGADLAADRRGHRRDPPRYDQQVQRRVLGHRRTITPLNDHVAERGEQECRRVRASAGIPPFHLMASPESSRRSQARTICQSASMVRLETPTTSATSSTVKPP